MKNVYFTATYKEKTYIVDTIVFATGEVGLIRKSKNKSCDLLWVNRDDVTINFTEEKIPGVEGVGGVCSFKIS